MQTLASTFKLSPAQSQAIFGATRAIVEADGPAGPHGQKLLNFARQTLEIDVQTNISATAPFALGQAVTNPQAREFVVHVLVIAACIETRVSEAGEKLVHDYAHALGVRSHWVALLPSFRKRRTFAIKRALMRRSPDAKRLFERTWNENGFRGLWHAAKFVAGRYRNPELAARFHELKHLPVGTLGRKFYDDFTDRGLAFPGEQGGIPEKMLHHDLMHIVNDYSTEPAGECQVAGFYAGFSHGDAFTFMMIILATFHFGLAVSPAIVTPTVGVFDPEAVTAAYLRGRKLKVDVMGQWDYWQLMPLPLTEVRQRLGLPPLTA